MSTIKQIRALEVLDSRGNPTVRCWVTLSSGAVGMASVPSGASTGSHEAWELRDNQKRYVGKGVAKAVAHVEGEIFKALKGKSVFDQRAIDEAMIALDGTPNKKRLGANAILGVSLACAHAAAAEKKQPLYRYIRSAFRLKIKEWRMPYLTMNIVNGGAHADNGLDVQEFMIVPQHKRLSERVRIGAEVFHALKSVIHEKGQVTGVGDEGGFAPNIAQSEQALKLIAIAIERAGYVLGKDVMFAMDVAASEFYENGVYQFEGKQLTAAQMVKTIVSWMKKYPFVSVEDPLDEDDWEHWPMALAHISERGVLGEAHVVGDDFFVTNVARLQRGIDEGCANAILIKVNQIGTLSEAIDAIVLAQKHNFAVSVSHRSGETGDTTIADIAVAVGAEYIKTGSLSRSERVEKYNRLMEIEREVV